MLDKEVGELWHWTAGQRDDGVRPYGKVRALIYKLVEERNCRRIGCQTFELHMHPFGHRPIADFGIPEEGWK